jgi:hypothetical protein
MEDLQACAPVVPIRFDANKVYLLVGCLGRSLSRWMMSRGAQHGIFVGRSSAYKPNAQELP